MHIHYYIKLRTDRTVNVVDTLARPPYIHPTNRTTTNVARKDTNNYTTVTDYSSLVGDYLSSRSISSSPILSKLLPQ